MKKQIWPGSQVVRQESAKLLYGSSILPRPQNVRLGGAMVDTRHLKCRARKGMGVRVSPRHQAGNAAEPHRSKTAKEPIEKHRLEPYFNFGERKIFDIDYIYHFCESKTYFNKWVRCFQVKTSAARTLLNDLPNSVYIGRDTLISVNPFGINEKLDKLAIKNLLSLVVNYSEEKYALIIVCGLIRNQQLLDYFLSKLPIKIEVLFVWLRASKEVRSQRRLMRDRDSADKLEHHEWLDKVMPDIDSFVLKNGDYLTIDTTAKTVQEVVNEIKTRL